MSGVTRSRIESLKPGLHWFSDGLGMRVGKSGSPKSWVHQKSGGKRTTLGRWPAMDVRQARLECAQRNMADMVEEEQVTLREATEQWERRLRLRQGSANTISTRWGWLSKHVPDYMDLPLSTLCNHKALLALHLDLGETSPVVANNVVRSLRAIWNVVSEDPWPGRKIQFFRDKRRETIVEDFADWERHRQSFSNPHIRALWLFVLLTRPPAKRRADGEIRNNIMDGSLHLPSPKGGERRAFDLPMSTHALQLIESLPRLGPFIFLGETLRIRSYIPCPTSCRRRFTISAEPTRPRPSL